MAIKAKITKSVFDALNVELQKEYKVDAKNADEYILDLEGYEDPGELRRARDREKIAATEAREAARIAKEELEESKRTGSRSNGDIAALELSWKTQKETEVSAEKEKTKKARATVTKLLVEDRAFALATQLSDSAPLLLPHIKQRLKVEYGADDEPITRVLDADGKPSALTVAQLGEEFSTSPLFASIIRASKASGGGASGNHSGGAAKKPSEFSEAERVALAKSNPTEFQRLFPPQQ